MRLLLDTNVLLWTLAAPAKLKVAARDLLHRSDVYVSAASIWEISIKSALGKIAADPVEICATLGSAGLIPLPVSHEHAARVRDLPPIHRDPFDRLLIAQAIHESMSLLTADRALKAYGDCIRLA